VTYGENIRAGTGTVTVDGAGNYLNSKNTVMFVINPDDLPYTVDKIEPQTYKGSQITPEVTVWDGDKELKLGIDYTVSYGPNINVGEFAGKFTITGINNYAGVPFEGTFPIIPKEIDFVIDVVEDIYSGNQVIPKFFVYDDTKLLAITTDYTVEYGENIDAGEGAGSIEIKGIGNYSGTHTATFTILPKKITFAIDDIAPKPYTGFPIEPEITVRDVSKKLTLDTDYEVSYGENIHVVMGGSVKVEGKGNYLTSSGERTFVIKPSDLLFTVDEIDDYEYNSDPIRPEVSVWDGDTKLTLGTDYNVSYENNINVGKGRVIITGRNNYEGSDVVVEFNIKPKKIDFVIDPIADHPYTGRAIEPVVVVRDDATQITDYTVSYRYNTNVGTGSVIITGTGNYAGNTGNTTFTITKAPLTFNARVDHKIYDGLLSATVTNGSVAFIGLVNNETLVLGTDYTVSAVFANVNVGNMIPVIITLNLSDTDRAKNYSLMAENHETNANITKAPITFVAQVDDKIYDGKLEAQVISESVTFIGLIDGEKLDEITDYTVSASFDDVNVANDKPVTITIALSGTVKANNYELKNPLINAKYNTTASISKALITFVAQAENKTYDGATDATVIPQSFVFSGLMGVETLAFNTDYTASAEFADANADNNKTVSITVTLSNTPKASNYELNNEPDNSKFNAIANITKAPLSITEPSVVTDRVYDGTRDVVVNNIGTIIDMVDGDDVTPNLLNATYNNKNVGTGKTITVRYTLSGADVNNYLPLENSIITTGEITKRPLTITDPKVTQKVYDGTTDIAVSSISIGTLDKERNDVITVNYSAEYDNKNVGKDKTVTVSYMLSGIDANNYFPLENSVIYTGEITTRTLSISKPNIKTEKVYDGTTKVTVNKDEIGILDKVPGDDLIADFYSTEYDDKNVGTDKKITVSYDLSGDDINNYSSLENTLIYTGEITKRPLSISEPDLEEEKIYDGTIDIVVNRIGDLNTVPDDDLTATLVNAEYDDKNVGTGKKITVSYDLSGDDINNYSSLVNTVITTGVIKPRLLTITEPDINIIKVYDGKLDVEYIEIGDIDPVPDDDLTATLNSAEYDDKNVGTGITITVKYTLNGDDAKNYIPLPNFITTGEITKRPLQFTASAKGKTYDGSPSALDLVESVIFDDLVDNEILYKNTDYTFDANFDNKDAGVNKPVTVTLALLDTQKANNYELANEPDDNLFITKATVEQKVLTLTADSKVCITNTELPELTFTYNLSEFIHGEDPSYIAESPTLKTNADLTKAGEYDIEFEGGWDQNYSFKYVPAKLVINPSRITVTYGADPFEVNAIDKIGKPSDYKINDPSILKGEIIDSVLLVTILKSGATDIIFNSAKNPATVMVVINKAELIAEADNKKRQQGEENPVFTITYSGFKRNAHYNDNESNSIQKPPSIDCAARSSSPEGDYIIRLLEGWESDKYVLRLIDGILTIIARENLPTAFTPDGEKNRLFLEGYEIQIYNRLGTLLYSGKEGWDGKYKGRTVQSGIYFYVSKSPLGIIQKGTVEVIKTR